MSSTTTEADKTELKAFVETCNLRELASLMAFAIETMPVVEKAARKLMFWIVSISSQKDEA